MTISKVFDLVTEVYNLILSFFTNIIDMIVDNPLVLAPVIISFMATILFFALGMVRRFRVRGVSAGGRRRRR